MQTAPSSVGTSGAPASGGPKSTGPASPRQKIESVEPGGHIDVSVAHAPKVAAHSAALTAPRTIARARRPRASTLVNHARASTHPV